MTTMNRVFAAAFVALLIFASHSRAEPEGMEASAPICGSSEPEAACP